MRRLPIYILLDTSSSMRGESIESVKTGLQAMLASLNRSPYALDTVSLSIITFDTEVKVLVPLTDIDKFQLPDFQIPETSFTNTGAGLERLILQRNNEVRKATPTQPGDWLPFTFIMTDGSPSDVKLFKEMTEKLKTCSFARIIACVAGPNQNVRKTVAEKMQQITDDVVTLDTMDSNSFTKFWEWASGLIEQQSQTADSTHGELPPPPEQINLVF